MRGEGGKTSGRRSGLACAGDRLAKTNGVAQRRPAQGAHRGEVRLAAKHGDRRQVHDHLRRPGQGSRRQPLTPVEPGYVTQRFPANQGQFQVRYVGRQEAMQSLTGDRSIPVLSAPPGHTTSPTGRLLPRSSARRSRSPSTRWGQVCGARSNEFGYANYEIIRRVEAAR